jgi:hypothetical protein
VPAARAARASRVGRERRAGTRAAAPSRPLTAAGLTCGGRTSDSR